jgi:hypothetical protein
MNGNEKLCSKAKFVVWLPTKYVKTESESAAFLARIKTVIGKETTAFIMEQPGNFNDARPLPN